MRTLIQRSSHCELSIGGEIVAQTAFGLLVLLGIHPDDTPEDVDYLARKISQLRIFDDENGVMNKSVVDISGEIMIVSQFTLYADTKKGNRPSYIHAAKPDVAIPLYELFIEKVKYYSQLHIETGVFGADMKINLTNDGPVTIWIDSKINNGN